MSSRETRRYLLTHISPVLGAALLILACSTPAPTAPSSAGGGSPASAPSSAPKTLVLGVQTEPITIVAYGRPGEGGTTSSRYERFYLFHANLTMFDVGGNIVPHIAQKVPTIENGDWKVSPDGTMEVTWKLRPDVFWHDGVQLTAQDFVFGLEVARDPKLAVAGLGELNKIGDVRAVDPQTLVVSWKSLSVNGNTNATEGVPAIPRHQLEDLYRAGDALAFQSSSAWRTEFLGLGPYRVTEWEAGSYLQAEAFGQYFLGRPKIDRLELRWVPDPTIVVAQLLAGAIDMVTPSADIKPVQLAEIQRLWGPDGGRTFTAPTDIRVLWTNQRIEGQAWDGQAAGWTQDKRFRQAILQSIDRQQLVDTIQLGFSRVALFPGFPEDPLYGLAEQQNLPKYPLDPTRASQLFAQAGWNKGPDGLLRNSGGQTAPFPCCRYASNRDSNDAQESLAVVSELQAAGIDARHPIPEVTSGLSASETRRAQTVGWAGQIGNFRITPDQYWAVLTAASLARQETGWAGINSGGWTDPAYESLFARWSVTLGTSQRRDIDFDLLKMVMDELPFLPLYYNPLGVAVRKGVEGVGAGVPLNRGLVTDIHTWDIR